MHFMGNFKWNCETRKVTAIPFAALLVRSFWISFINWKSTSVVQRFNSTIKLTVLKRFCRLSNPHISMYPKLFQRQIYVSSTNKHQELGIEEKTTVLFRTTCRQKFAFPLDVRPPWRNGLACWTSNSKVVGSSPTGGGIFPF